MSWVVVLLRRPLTRGVALGLALLIAGGAGNLIDRVARPGGRVVDFAQLGVRLGPLDARTGVFNVADLAIVKDDGTTSVNAGASTVYTITVTNNGPSAIAGAILADPAKSVFSNL